MGKKLICGLDVQVGTDIQAALSYSNENGYAFISTPIVHPRYKRDVTKKGVIPENVLFTRSDLLLNGQDWGCLVIGKLSDRYDVDSKDESYRKSSEEFLMQEIYYANHLGLLAVMFKLDGHSKTNLARLIYDRSHYENTSYQLLFWVHVPMISLESMTNLHRMDEAGSKNRDTWNWWNDFKLKSNSERRLGVALEVTADLPPEEELKRWFGEPLKVILVPTSIFLTNKKGFPVLSIAHQNFIRKCATFNLQLLITGNCRHTSIKNYVQYLEHIYQSTPYTEQNTPFTKGFEDHLQIPLQPLMDNLESCTYEVFEKDPIKYTEYGRAIYEALIDRVPEEEKSTNVQVVMIVGAGRGPLVNAALSSANRSGRKIRCYAVEKNPMALITLLTLKAEMWGDKVEVVGSDMRFWNAPEKCDILVSELLGSFGDNELSPECLDGAQKFLKEDGISIPCQYTSHLCPTQSSKLYNEAKAATPVYKHPDTKYEMPYVVHQVTAYTISKTQPLFTFVHPNKDPVIDNRRYSILKFPVELDSVLNGFTGYFDAVLYKDIKLSIVPETFSKGMFSWFPVFFPIKTPVKVKKGDEIEVHFWRLSNEKTVWYEWCVSSPAIVPVHNPNGRSYNIGLF